MRDRRNSADWLQPDEHHQGINIGTESNTFKTLNASLPRTVANSTSSSPCLHAARNNVQTPSSRAATSSLCTCGGNVSTFAQNSFRAGEENVSLTCVEASDRVQNQENEAIVRTALRSGSEYVIVLQVPMVTEYSHSFTKVDVLRREESVQRSLGASREAQGCRCWEVCARQRRRVTEADDIFSKVMDCFPSSKFFLVGDSGEHGEPQLMQS